MKKSSRKTVELDAGGVRPADLLKADVQYRAPVFQRHYVWKQKQFDLLWNDLSLLHEDEGEVESRFLGAIVLEDQGGGLATDPDEYLIVDGQQRLLTLYMLLVAVAQLARELGTVASKDFAGDLVRQRLVNQGSKIAGAPKVIPTLDDFAQFKSVMQALSPTTSVTLPTSYGPVEGHMTAMFERMRAALSRGMAASEAEQPGGTSGRIEGSDTSDKGAARLEYVARVANTVLNKLQFVEIVLGEGDDPHHVFDRLNDAGVKLDVADLVRNDVFQRMAHDPIEAEKLHANEWTPFESSLNRRIEEFVFPYALIKRPGTTKGRMMGDLRDEWEGWEASDVLVDLTDFVPAFNAVVTGAWPAKAGALSPVFLTQIDRLARMPIPSSIYPYAMMVIRATASKTLTDVEGTRDLLLVESFLVRRALAGFEPTGLHSLFKVMWERTNGDPAKLLKEIENRPTVQFPDDKQFTTDIKTRPLYGRRLAGYILAEYDQSLAGDPTPDIKPTVDHVMPRKLPASWAVPAAEHRRTLHLWGNLVPLSGMGNASKGNEQWPKVEKRLLAESAFKTPRALALRYKTWGPREVDKRSSDLAGWATRRWPRT